MINSLFDDMAKKSMPKLFLLFRSHLKDGHCVYKPGRDPDTKQNKFWGVFEADNIIVTNLDSSAVVKQMNIFAAYT